MSRLVTLSRSGIVKDTPLAPSPSRAASRPRADPLTPAELKTVRQGQESFVFFLENVFPLCFEGQLFLQADGSHQPFSLGEFHRDLANTIEQESRSGGRNRFCILAPRLHLKSTVLNHAFAFWQLFRGYRTGGRDLLTAEDVDGLVISYKDDLAADHIRNTKRLIEANPLTRLWRDRKQQAEAVISYEVDFGLGHTWLGEVRASGITSAARGKHPKFVIVDDPLSDFANPAEATELERIERIFFQVILSLPRRGDPVVVIGTPQAEDDLLHKLASNDWFVWQRHPAISDEESRRVLWPEVFSYDVLGEKRREVGEKAFLVEYMLVPLRTLDGYFSREEIEACVNPEMLPYSLDEQFPEQGGRLEGVYAGIDIGKEVHPTHISVLAKFDGHLIQVYERFLDKVDYNRQVRIINQLVEHFKIRRVYYDSTRGELDDRGLSSVVHGVKFTSTKRVALAQGLERHVRGRLDLDEPRLILLGPTTSRQVNSILAVNQSWKRLPGEASTGTRSGRIPWPSRPRKTAPAWSWASTWARCSTDSTRCVGGTAR